MKKRVPHSQTRLDAFFRNPANDSSISDDADFPSLPRSVTDNFQRWATEQIGNLTQQVKRLKKIALSQENIITDQSEEIADLKFKLAEANARADRDGLTGLFNKAYFTRELYAIYQNNVSKNDRRKGAADTLLMIDLDGFKPINDNYGHAAGDQALCEVAGILTSCVRESDIVARMGGDEFAVILRGSSLKDSQLKEIDIERKLNSLAFAYNNATIAVRGSVGSTPIDWKKLPSENLEIADRNMYLIKQAKGDTRFTMNIA